MALSKEQLRNIMNKVHKEWAEKPKSSAPSKTKALKKSKGLDKIEKHFGKTHEEMHNYQRRTGRAYSD